jgi:anti-sigma regulatory factor (Ser/Thr protein kinase)
MTDDAEPRQSGVAGAEGGYTHYVMPPMGTDGLCTDDPRVARRVLTGQLTSWGLTHLADDLELIVTELVTNACRHAGGVRGIELTARDGRVRVEVSDSDPTLPAKRLPTSDQPGGRGLLLVEALSRAWGAEPDARGKVVWAEVAPAEG